jgi:ParB family transcriptional regulator, chromosome partitioning protein
MNKAENPRKVLGKGLNALLSNRTQAPPPPLRPAEPQPTPEPTSAEEARFVAIDAIDANPLQPRRIFQPDRLAELAQSIRANGIVQPIVVRRAGERYQLVAGERRWRAAKLAGLDKVPVVVRDIADERLLEITLIENIQREDLNAIETAVAFERLGQELNLSAEQVGERTGKDRTTVINFLRLLQLPTDLQQLVAERRLSQGHARCLLSLPTPELQREVAEKAVAQGWSVRQTERTTQKMVEGRKAKHVDEVQVDPNVKAAITEMERALGTKVRIIEKAKRGGRIEIEYYSAEDLDRIYSTIVSTT